MLHQNLQAMALAAAVIALAGCASPGAVSDLAPTAGAESLVSAPPTVGIAPQVAPDAPQATALAWDQVTKDAALAVATKAMDLYARPSVGEAQWLADLKHLLTPAAAEDYSYVDPALIPISTVGRRELVVDEANGFAAQARFGSPAGTYAVQLLRKGKDAPFQVVRFVPPQATP